ncbi:hypothetical protein MMC32_002785 [Xylographa parallela]|nr:hypothetical protein [Xylographa parallela]
MAPQTSIPTAANVLGTIGTVFWCVQLVPQIWHNWKAKKTEGLPALMMVLWAACAVPFGVYSVVQNFNVPIQIQPQVFGTLALVTWAQILIYENKWKTWKAIALVTGVFVLCGAIEAVLIVALKGPYDRGVEWPMLAVGIIAAILVGAGILPPYWEMWKRNGRVIGINWIFLSMDSAGALFSLLALVAQDTFDVLGGCVYLVVVILEGGIFTSHCIWLFRTRKLRKRAKLQGVSFDDLPEARIYQDKKAKTTTQSYGSFDSRPCPSAVISAADPAELEKVLTVPEPIYRSGHLNDMSETYLPGDLESGSLDMPTWDLKQWVP